MTSPTAPPSPEQRPVTTETHGDTRIDEYGWLRDREDPATVAHLEAENAWTEERLAHLAPVRERLFEEIRARIVETDLSVPARRGPWWYYSRTQEGLSYPIHCRREAIDDVVPLDPPSDDAEVVLYDENHESGDAEFFSVGILGVSPDHQSLAVATDTVGNERYTLSFRHLDDRVNPTEAIEDVSYGFAWSKDAAHCFYTRVDEAWRPFQLWRHQIGTEPSADVLVLEESDARFNIGVGKSRDGEVIMVSVSSSATSETRWLPSDNPTTALSMLLPRSEGVEHFVEHAIDGSGNRWWLNATNESGAIDFRLDAARVTPGPVSWSTVIPHRPGTRLEGVDAFASALVLSERGDAETQLRIIALEGRDLLSGNLLEGARVLRAERDPQATWLDQNPESNTTKLRIGQTSLVDPTMVGELDLDTFEINVLKRQQVRGGYEIGDYRTWREWATASDGTPIPISLVARRDLALPAPCLLYGYGAYEISMDPAFSAGRLVLLDQGVVFAIAHVRGGGEMGRGWYDAGHLDAKENSFSDFAACADHLLSEGVTTRSQLAARGGSAGGLLMGAVANQFGDRFAAILGEVAFVDALNTMLDPSLPLTVGEYEEWGNPTADSEAYAAIKSYAPYENVSSDQTYPAMLFTGGLNDTRVGFWEPAKFVARLRERVPGIDALLRMEMGVGHGGPSGRYDSWREEAFVLAWLLEQIGALRS
jgi:oligopeptidase B